MAKLLVLLMTSMFLAGCAKSPAASSKASYSSSWLPRGAALGTGQPADALPAATGTISCPAEAPGTTHDYLTCSYVGPNNAHMTFYLYIPQSYNPQQQQQYPLVLMLHGVGERAQASQTAAQNRTTALRQPYIDVWGQGAPPGGPSVQQRWPCFVVVPQVVAPQRWVDTQEHGTYTLASEPSASLEMAMVIVELLQQQYTGIDSNRLYITGISMGGYGVWDAIERWPTYFAAAVPVAAAGDPKLAGSLADLPIWDFHGAADTTAPSAGSRTMYQAIHAAGGHSCYTEYPGIGHVIWDAVYGLGNSNSNPLYSWLFAQRKGSQVTSPACSTE